MPRQPRGAGVRGCGEGDKDKIRGGSSAAALSAAKPRAGAGGPAPGGSLLQKGNLPAPKREFCLIFSIGVFTPRWGQLPAASVAQGPKGSGQGTSVGRAVPAEEQVTAVLPRPGCDLDTGVALVAVLSPPGTPGHGHRFGGDGWMDGCWGSFAHPGAVLGGQTPNWANSPFCCLGQGDERPWPRGRAGMGSGILRDLCPGRDHCPSRPHGITAPQQSSSQGMLHRFPGIHNMSGYRDCSCSCGSLGVCFPLPPSSLNPGLRRNAGRSDECDLKTPRKCV